MTSRATKPTAPDPRDQIEALRSELVAGIVIAATLDYSGQLDDSGAAVAGPTQAVLRAFAQELGAWHAAKPEQNGAV